MATAPFDLQGKNAVIASWGGKNTQALASALLEAGASVALVLPESASSGNIGREVAHNDSKAELVSWAGGDMPGVQAGVEQAIARLGAIDVLVNDLSRDFAKPFVEMTADEWQQTIRLNLDSVFYACKAGAAHMLQQQSGRIINVASGLGARVVVNESAFCASMAGVLQLTKALGLEWARDNIRVNAIAAGWIVESEDEFPDNIRRYIPMQRWGKPEDLGGLLVYLASDSCSFTTGETVFVDGGVMIRT